ASRYSEPIDTSGYDAAAGKGPVDLRSTAVDQDDPLAVEMHASDLIQDRIVAVPLQSATPILDDECAGTACNFMHVLYKYT
ncbi:MAG TPA: hypothetical protein VN936_04910, partial [Candidatus Acidoferrum sp.]|nr:hypothetical protein [Candidatus Acidoferrum sp.]